MITWYNDANIIFTIAPTALATGGTPLLALDIDGHTHYGIAI